MAWAKCSPPPPAGWASPGSSWRRRSACCRIETQPGAGGHRASRGPRRRDGAARVGDDRYRYSVAWIDCLAGGRRLGRSVLSRGDHAPADGPSTASRRGEPAGTRPGSRHRRAALGPVRAASTGDRAGVQRGLVPQEPRASERGQRGSAFGAFFHPLDGVARLEPALRARAGSLQYQLVVPFGAEATIRRRARAARARRGRLRSWPFSSGFGAELGPALVPDGGLDAGARHAGRTATASADLLDDLDRLVVEAGGRVYLAKDSRLQPGAAAAHVPADRRVACGPRPARPDRRMRSDLARRLGL